MEKLNSTYIVGDAHHIVSDHNISSKLKMDLEEGRPSHVISTKIKAAMSLAMSLILI
jgi:hypothetical protein